MCIFPREGIISLYYESERGQQRKIPDLPYSKLLATVYPTLTLGLGLAAPSPDEHIKSSESIAHWPAFPDAVEEFSYLRKYYKLVVLSNVDRASFARTNAGGLESDLVTTAGDISSNKPDLRNLKYILDSANSAFDIDADQVLQTAQSQLQDHHLAH